MIFFKELVALEFIDKIYLYGSRSRKDNQPRSDIDLAFDCASASIKDWDKVVRILEDADTLLEFDYVRLDKLDNDNPLKINILKSTLIFKRAR